MMAKARITPLLAVENLRALVPTPGGLVHAVDGVSFALEPGKTLGVVGESGCGKTMMARSLMGLLPRNTVMPPETTIEFLGQSMLGLPGPHLRRILGKDIAMIFQDPMISLNPVIKVGKQIAEVLTHHLQMDKQAARDRAVELLKQVGIPMAERRFNHYPHQLSGGLRQRVAIAIALACEPQLLIADEPTTALDVTVQTDILDLLAKIQQDKRMAMILVSHDLGVVAGRTHDTAVLYAGKIVEQAATTELFEHTAMPYTRALMDAIPRLTDPPHTTLQAIGGHPPDLIAPPPGCRFAPRCSRAEARCRQLEPALRNIAGKNHQFACWYPLETK
jgi:oligopeptide/dipeptide ABC transporter ATP-binding protein